MCECETASVARHLPHARVPRKETHLTLLAQRTMADDWSHTPGSFEDAPTNGPSLVKLLLRSLQMPHSQWTASSISSLVEGAKQHADPWAQLVGSMFVDYGESGRINNRELDKSAQQLAASLSASIDMPEGSSPGWLPTAALLTLRSGIAASNEHFHSRATAVAALAAAFKPLDPAGGARAATGAGVALSSGATTASSGSKAPSSSALASAPAPSASVAFQPAG